MSTVNDAFSGGWRKLRKLSLPREGRMIGGVCTALGEATPIPAWMWRAAFCASVLMWGTGVIAYLVLMVCIPEAAPKKV